MNQIGYGNLNTTLNELITLTSPFLARPLTRSMVLKAQSLRYLEYLPI